MDRREVSRRANTERLQEEMEEVARRHAARPKSKWDRIWELFPILVMAIPFTVATIHKIIIGAWVGLGIFFGIVVVIVVVWTLWERLRPWRRRRRVEREDRAFKERWEAERKRIHVNDT